MFWNQSVAADNARTNYSYPDLEEDDGDIDMFAGLSAYYTGSPGVEIGDFTGFYPDSLGNQIEIEYGLCTQVGAQGQDDSHAGRAASSRSCARLAAETASTVIYALDLPAAVRLWAGWCSRSG